MRRVDTWDARENTFNTRGYNNRIPTTHHPETTATSVSRLLGRVINSPAWVCVGWRVSRSGERRAVYDPLRAVSGPRRPRAVPDSARDPNTSRTREPKTV